MNKKGPISKEQSAFKPNVKISNAKPRKPIPKQSEKMKAEMENRKTWTAEQFLTALKEGKKEKRRGKKSEKKKSTPLSKIQSDFDVIYSLVVKMEPADNNGIVRCYCGEYLHWTKANNSHFIPRSTAPSIKFDRMNTHPSCIPCNGFKEGNREAYIPWMENKYGKEEVELLRLRGNKKSGNGTFEYQIMLQEYINLFLVQCVRLNYTPKSSQQKIIDKYGI